MTVREKGSDGEKRKGSGTKKQRKGETDKKKCTVRRVKMLLRCNKA